MPPCQHNSRRGQQQRKEEPKADKKEKQESLKSNLNLQNQKR